jgi:SAM-dependent methyltransferase
MEVPDRWRDAVGAQLRHPHGLPGLVVGRVLNHYNKAVIAEAVGALDIPPGAMLADFGFGGGTGLELLMAALEDGGQVHGVDHSTAMLGAASRRFARQISSGLLVLHEAPLEHLPLETSSLDGVITLNTIYFISDLAAALSEWARVLKPSGQLVIGLGDPDTMAGQPLTAHGFRVRPLTEVTNALLSAGLEVDQHRLIGTGENATHLLLAQPY